MKTKIHFIIFITIILAITFFTYSRIKNKKQKTVITIIPSSQPNTIPYINTTPQNATTSKIKHYYFNNDIYSMPGTLNPTIIDIGIMPYESAVPAIDILRANNKPILPSYYNQYLRKNITP